MGEFFHNLSFSIPFVLLGILLLALLLDRRRYQKQTVWSAPEAGYENALVYPLRTGKQTGPAETPGDGWVKFSSTSGKAVMFHVSFKFSDISELQNPKKRNPKTHLIPPSEVLAARFRLADGREGSFADLFREVIAHWPEHYANRLDGKDIDDGPEMGAEMVLESTMWELMRERCDAFANRSFSYMVHVSFRQVTEHEQEVGNIAHAVMMTAAA